jgi:DNA-binding transcriptional ArsR family regulator
MGWWQVSADTLAGSRFVISPLAETTASLIALDRGVAAHPGERQWLDAHRAAYQRYTRDHPVVPAILRVAAARWWVPALVTAPPVITGAPVSGGEASFGDELSQIISMPPDVAAADLAEAGLRATAEDLPRMAAELLAWVWEAAVQRYWPTRRRIIEADIVARTTQLGRGGWAEALSDMRPGMRWLGNGRLQINALDRPPREISGAQLFFVPVTPSTAGWVAWDEPHRYALTYSCSGQLAHGARAATPETLAALLGPARAAILTLLDTPKTTTHLVALTGQRLGSVGRHLQILRAAGLLERRRVGRSVLYHRSPAGDLLVRIQDEAGLPGLERHSSKVERWGQAMADSLTPMGLARPHKDRDRRDRGGSDGRRHRLRAERRGEGHPGATVAAARAGSRDGARRYRGRPAHPVP